MTLKWAFTGYISFKNIVFVLAACLLVLYALVDLTSSEANVRQHLGEFNSSAINGNYLSVVK